jgi:GGDEF domain-containing protein
VLQPITAYLQEVTSRFSGSLQQTPGALDGATALLKILAAAFNQQLPADSTAARCRTAEFRRLLNSLQLLERQLQAQLGRSEAVEQLAAAQERFEVQQKQQVKSVAAAASTPGPGELHPSGPRHNNDKVMHEEISVAPTREEALCTQKPFLPANR